MLKFTVTVDEDTFRESMVKDMKEVYLDQKLNWKHEPDTEKIGDALLTVIEFYMIPTEFDAWYETIKEL